MSRHRFYIPPEDWNAGQLQLSGDEAHHCLRVFRHQPGDRIEAFNGEGKSVLAKISDVHGKSVSLRPIEWSETPAPPVSLTLIQAVPKGKTMDLIVQKAVEIGASAIVPLQTARGVVKLDAGKADKWQRVALEACKQCGRDWLPTVSQPSTIPDLLETDRSALRLVASLDEAADTLKEPLAASPDSVSIAIGPEGDFTTDELRLLLENGFRPVTLGAFVLRSETAAIYSLSILSYELLNRPPLP